jgi:hypothetical protein
MDFRKKLLGLAGATMVFAGMANAQLVCTTILPTPGAIFIRAEGQTEALPTLTISGCSGSAGGTASVTVFLSSAAPITITSAVNATTTPLTEASITPNGGATTFGSINGSSVVFNNVVFTAATTSFTISNVRINATTIPTVNGTAPTAVNALAFVSGIGAAPGPLPSVPVAYAFNGLQTSKAFTNASQTTALTVAKFAICNSLTPAAGAPSFYVSVNENFQSAFKKQSDEAGPLPDVVSSGTRIKVVFGNVPSGLTIYLPTSVVASDGAILTATTSETGSFAASSVATTPTSVSGLGLFLVPSSAGTATAIYEITSDNLSLLDTFSVPVFLLAGTDAVVIQATNMNVQTSFAPITAATTVPSFVVGSSTAAVDVLGFTSCQTSLLFPFVTNQAGFETGIAIANTSVDPFTINPAKPQSGICMLNYYGASSTVPNPKPTQAPNQNEGGLAPYLAGETYPFLLTTALAATTGNPATFQGYIIAQCNFQFAHGFAYIVYQFPGTSSDTMGYLALVLNNRGSTGAESVGQ